jgi:hypothetical protein
MDRACFAPDRIRFRCWKSWLVQPLPTVPLALPRERGPIRRGAPAIAASHVDEGLVSPGKSQITDNERALVSCT